MRIIRSDTAVVFIDPQNEVLSEKGAAWAAVGASVRENGTVENMERIFHTAKKGGFEVLRDLVEQGFEVLVVLDATAGPRHPEWGDGYAAARINYAFLAHGVLRTDAVVAAMERP